MNRICVRSEQKTVAIDRALLKNIIAGIMAHERPGIRYEVGVCLVPDRRIQNLNRRFHGRDIPTDVLAFSLGRSADEIIADIYVSTQTAVSQSLKFGTNPRYETYLYCVHGVLHCVGLDDRTPAGRRAMRRAEKKYLNKFHIK